MTDVVEIAKERRATLAAEIGKLDDFIRMAEALLKHSLSKSSKASDTEDEKAAGGNGAEAEREDLPVRELNAGERVGNRHVDVDINVARTDLCSVDNKSKIRCGGIYEIHDIHCKHRVPVGNSFDSLVLEINMYIVAAPKTCLA